MSIDLYNQRTMIRALETRFKPRMFLRDMFFHGQDPQTHTTTSFDIDIFKGKRRVAPYVKPIHQGVLVEKEGFTTKNFTPPYVKPKFVSKAQDFLTREIGKTMYAPGDGPSQRAQKQLGKELAEGDDMISRLEETQAAQLMETGKVVVTGKGYDGLEIDFGMDANHIITLSGTDLWTDAASQPLEQFRAWNQLTVKDAGLQIKKEALYAQPAV